MQHYQKLCICLDFLYSVQECKGQSFSVLFPSSSCSKCICMYSLLYITTSERAIKKVSFLLAWFFPAQHHHLFSGKSNFASHDSLPPPYHRRQRFFTFGLPSQPPPPSNKNRSQKSEQV